MVDIEEIRKRFDAHDIDSLKNYIKLELLKTAASLNPNWHPLGFIHCKLTDSSTTEIYRLHIWPTTMDPIDPQEHKIHDHLFDVESIVLLGSIENNEFEFLSSSHPPSHRVIEVEYTKDAPLFHESGIRGTLTKTRSNTSRAGERYRVNRKILHETCRQSDELAITLVRTSNPMKVSPRVVLPINASLPPIRPPKIFPLNEWLSILNNVLQ